MYSQRIGPFIISKVDPRASLSWPFLPPDMDGDLPIHISFDIPSLKTAKFQIGLIEFVTSVGGALMQAITFGSSGDPDDFGGLLPELNLEVNTQGRVVVSLLNEGWHGEYDALAMLRELVLLGDSELVPLVSVAEPKLKVSAPTVGITLGVRSTKVVVSSSE
jgi:hypothetical protein